MYSREDFGTGGESGVFRDSVDVYLCVQGSLDETLRCCIL